MLVMVNADNKMSRVDSYRVLVVGEKAVGKSALVVKYLTGRFIWEYQSDKEIKYNHKIQIDGEGIPLEILDSVSLDENQIRWAEGFIIVYDVTNQKSFESVASMKDKLEKIKSARNMSFIVIGNKTDLTHCRVVNSEKGEKLCNKLTAGHFECSACGANDHEQTIIIWEAFEELCREIQQRRRLNSQARIRRRSSLSQVKQNLKMLVTPNKSKNSSNGLSTLLSSSASGGTLGRGSRRGSCASTGKGEVEVRSVENGKHLSPTGCNSPKRSRSPRPDKNMNGFFTNNSIRP